MLKVLECGSRQIVSNQYYVFIHESGFLNNPMFLSTQHFVYGCVAVLLGISYFEIA